ncbi:MAG: hypothetical protein ACLQDC_18955, partial [Verrucomicrobiia bacterium]
MIFLQCKWSLMSEMGSDAGTSKISEDCARPWSSAALGEDDRGQSFQLSFQLQRHCKFGFVDSGSALGVE